MKGRKRRIASACFALGFALSAAAEDECNQLLKPQNVIHARTFAEAFDFREMQGLIEMLNGQSMMSGNARLSDRSSALNRELVRQLLTSHMRYLGLRPEIEAFPGGANVSVEIAGRRPEVVEVIAHFSSYVGPTGANIENSIGMALLSALARQFRETKLERGLRLVFLDKSGLAGSAAQAHLEVLRHDSRPIVGSFVIESNGFFPKDLGRPFSVALLRAPEAELTEGERAFARAVFYPLRSLPIDRGLTLSPESDAAQKGLASVRVYWNKRIPALVLNEAAEKEYHGIHREYLIDRVQGLNLEYLKNFCVTFSEILANLVALAPGAKPVNSQLQSLQDLTAILDLPLPPPAARSLSASVEKTEPSERPQDLTSEDVAQQIRERIPGFEPNGYEIDAYKKFKSRSAHSRILVLARDRSELLGMVKGHPSFSIFRQPLIDLVMGDLQREGGYVVEAEMEGDLDWINLSGKAELAKVIFGNAEHVPETISVEGYDGYKRDLRVVEWPLKAGVKK